MTAGASGAQPLQCRLLKDKNALKRNLCEFSGIFSENFTAEFFLVSGVHLSVDCYLTLSSLRAFVDTATFVIGEKMISVQNRFKNLATREPNLVRAFMSVSAFKANAVLLNDLALGRKTLDDDARQRLVGQLTSEPLDLWFPALDDQCIVEESTDDTNEIFYQFSRIQGAGSDGVAVRVISIEVNADTGDTIEKRSIIKVSPIDLDNLREALFLEKLQNENSPNILPFIKSFQCNRLPTPPGKSGWLRVEKKFQLTRIAVNEDDVAEVRATFPNATIGRYLYLSTEFASRGDLNRFFQNQLFQLNVSTLYSLALQLLAGLRSVHRQLVAHRDMHTGNLLVDEWSTDDPLPSYDIAAAGEDVRVKLHSIQASDQQLAEYNVLIGDFGRSSDESVPGATRVDRAISQIEIRAPESLFAVLNPVTNELEASVTRRSDLWAAAVDLTYIFSVEGDTFVRPVDEFRLHRAFLQRSNGVRLADEVLQRSLSRSQRYLKWITERNDLAVEKSIRGMRENAGNASIIDIIALVTFIDEFTDEFGNDASANDVVVDDGDKSRSVDIDERGNVVFSDPLSLRQRRAQGGSNKSLFADGGDEETAMVIWRLVRFLGTDQLIEWLRSSTGIESERLLRDRVPMYGFMVNRALPRIRRNLRILENRRIIGVGRSDYEYNRSNQLENSPQQFHAMLSDVLTNENQRDDLLQVVASGMRWNPEHRDSASELLDSLFAAAEKIEKLDFQTERATPTTRAKRPRIASRIGANLSAEQRRVQAGGLTKREKNKVREAPRGRAYTCSACNERFVACPEKGYTCSACRLEYYCSARCAHRHWNEQRHFAQCRALEHQR